MTTDKYRVRVTKDHLVFSAAHFITFNGNICERLHGHNWRVAVEVTGPLDDNSYVFDFIALRDATQFLVNELDHHVLLPTKHPSIHVTVEDREVTTVFESRRWIFPREDCVLLPVANTTAELIAHWMANRLKVTLGSHPGASKLQTLTVEIEENFGQWATCQIAMND